MTQLFVNRLTVIDCSYLDSQRGIVGESWQVNLVLHGSLDEQGMVLDFGDIKKQVKRIIDECFDHKLLVAKQNKKLSFNQEGDYLSLDFERENGSHILHKSPRSAVCFIEAEDITIDNIEPAIIDELKPHLPTNVEKVTLQLWPEHIEGAFYHYSHGLKHHCGNCQRIAHGHRSRIEIYRDNQRDNSLEADWAERWRDIYIGTREDAIDSGNESDVAFRYTSEQGQFFLQLAKESCYLIDTDSTVENLAAHIADTLQKEHPTNKIKVYAFEGVDKGAVG